MTQEDTSRGRILQEAEKWGEYTWAKEKMGRVLLREGKNGGGSILRGRKKWGEYTPQGVFGTFPYFGFS